jgi:hypothetical protein
MSSVVRYRELMIPPRRAKARNTLNVGGGLMFLRGTMSFLQGINVLARQLRTGQIQCAAIGAAMLGVGRSYYSRMPPMLAQG